MTSTSNSKLELEAKTTDWDEVTVQNFDKPEDGDHTFDREKPALGAGESPFNIERQAAEFVEGGFEGWKAVFGCALVAGPSIGWNNAWGVFQRYHATHFLRGTPNGTLGVIGASQSGIMMALAFVSGKFGDRYGYKRFIAAGCIVVFLGQLIAAFCHDVWSIFLTQGMMHGFGCGLLTPMVFAIPSQWFRKHRGVATGIVVAGASFGGAVPSLVVQEMLDRIGFRKTLLIYSFVQCITMLIGFSLIKTRSSSVNSPAALQKIQWIDKKYLTDPMFWSCWMALFFTFFAHMPALTFISVYTSEKIPHITSRLANLPIPIISFASVVGRTTVGLIGDRIGFINVFILVISISAFSQLVLWNVAAESYAGIMVFSIIFGLTGPCALSLVTPIAATIYGTYNLATLTGLFTLSNVPGLFGGPPIGGVILDSSGHNWHALAGYSGGVQLLGVLCILYARFKRQPMLFGKI